MKLKFRYSSYNHYGSYKFRYDTREEIHTDQLIQPVVFWGSEIKRCSESVYFSFIERKVKLYQLIKFFQKLDQSHLFKSTHQLLLSRTNNKYINTREIDQLRLDLDREEYISILQDSLLSQDKCNEIKNILNHLALEDLRENEIYNILEALFTKKHEYELMIFLNLLLKIKSERHLDVLEKTFDMRINMNKKLIAYRNKENLILSDIRKLNEQDSLHVLEKNDLLNCKVEIYFKKLERVINESIYVTQNIVLNKKKYRDILVANAQHTLIRMIKELYRNEDIQRYARKINKIYDEQLKLVTRNFEKEIKEYNSCFLKRKIEKDLELKKEVVFYIRNNKKDALRETIKLLLIDMQKTIIYEFIQKLQKDIDRNLQLDKSLLNFDKVQDHKEISIKNSEKLISNINTKELLKIFHEIFLDKYFFEEIMKEYEIKYLDKKIIPKDIQIFLRNLLKKSIENIHQMNDIDIEKDIKSKLLNLLNNPRNFKKHKVEVIQEVADKNNFECEQRSLSKEEVERDLNLYKRFWFLNEIDIKDFMILPCHDFDYENNSIKFNVDEMIPENHHSVYPNEFYKEIDRHPIPYGKDFGPDEIGIPINILIDIINIFILMWWKFYPAFWGWTGTQAVIGITKSIYDWITLETSIHDMKEKEVKEAYERAYRWIRWEAEKMALKARGNMELKGNYYVGLFLEELIYYMTDHHFDIMPIFKDVNKMDEWRNNFNRSPQNDIKWVLDKVKGIRHKIIDERKEG
ncbi:hypothetical protein [Anaerophilus nitritogenes]|uniref:hypothetical protein n=1 Tax=Anaerophilus nitritogenes TaxID=2498136 RepID=UPI00101D6944|nr:hypothetical protein [Anaerophilus nitritogenes]